MLYQHCYYTVKLFLFAQITKNVLFENFIYDNIG